MMNYRHAFHAGNHADVLKHAILVFCLERLRTKPAPFGVLDTHAGRGMYDLGSDAASRSPEWRGGVERVWAAQNLPPLLSAYRDAVATHNSDAHLRYYPGSPALVAHALRSGDRLAACELNTEEAAALRARFRGLEGVHVHQRDGWEALKGLLPMPEKRGLVLIDPPYEQPDELTRGASGVLSALERFGHGSVAWWRPLKFFEALDSVDAELHQATERSWLRADFWVSEPDPNGRLAGSSMLLFNPPFGLEGALNEALATLAALLAQDASAGYRITKRDPE